MTVPAFLGKPVPRPSAGNPAAPLGRNRLRRRWQGLVLAGVGLLLLTGFSSSFSPQISGRPTGGLDGILASVPAYMVGIVEAANTNYSPTACGSGGSPLNNGDIFPLLDPHIFSLDLSGCNPTNWNLNVFWVLGYKVLFLLNWLADVLAVLLTIYAGLLYISGFANEGNVKKAKALLITCYVGLAIVFGARMILLGFADIFTNQTVDSTQIGNTFHQ